jgi:hypothetical protein
MKRTRTVAIVVVLILILIAIAVPLVLWSAGGGAPMGLPSGAVTAYRLNPDAEAATNLALARLHDWAILGQSPGPLSAAKAEEIRDLLESASTYGEYAALCMQPELAFRFGEGDDATDVIVSISCHRAQFRRGAKVEAVPLSEAGVKAFSQTLRSLFPADMPTPPATAP